MEDFLKDFEDNIGLEKNSSYNTLTAYLADVRAFMKYLREETSVDSIGDVTEFEIKTGRSLML